MVNGELLKFEKTSRMFLTLNHQKLDVYSASKEVVIECYKLTNKLPSEERYGMISQIRRAALSVHLNIAEGCSRKSEVERKRYYEVARGSLIEVDAALDIANEINYLMDINTESLGASIIKCFKILTGLIQS
jgi:four helix bundle protein